MQYFTTITNISGLAGKKEVNSSLTALGILR